MCWSFFLHQFLLLLCQYFVFLYSSMTASPTATNHAMLSSSGPKVTARGCCHPTDLSATLEKTECCVMSELSNPAPHTMRTLSVTQQESFHHNVADCCTGNVLQPLLFAHAVPSLAFSVFTPHPMTPPLRCHLQAWTLVALAATSMRRNPVQWPSLEPLWSSASSLFSTQHWPSTTVLFVGPLGFFSLSQPDSFLSSLFWPAASRFFLHHEEWLQKTT